MFKRNPKHFRKKPKRKKEKKTLSNTFQMKLKSFYYPTFVHYHSANLDTNYQLVIQSTKMWMKFRTTISMKCMLNNIGKVGWLSGLRRYSSK